MARVNPSWDKSTTSPIYAAGGFDVNAPGVVRSPGNGLGPEGSAGGSACCISAGVIVDPICDQAKSVSIVSGVTILTCVPITKTLVPSPLMLTPEFNVPVLTPGPCSVQVLLV